MVVGVTIAALVHFVPQDLIFVALAGGSANVPKSKVSDIDGAVESFKAKKGLEKV